MTGALVAGVVAGYGVALPLGAVGVYLIGLGARVPRTTAGAAALGVATTDGCYALAAALGGVGLEQLLRPVAIALRLAAVLALGVLAVRTIRAAVLRYRAATTANVAVTTGPGPAGAFATLLGLTALNPGTLGYFAALVLGRPGSGAHRSAAAAAVFAVAVFAASASWQLLLVGGGAALRRALAGARGQLGLALASGALMLGLAATLALA